MARRSGSDKFSVGQRAILVLDAASGWQRLNGESCIVIAPKRRMSIWVTDMDGGNCNLRLNTYRYVVRHSAGELRLYERGLRAIDDREEISTWVKFRKVTGIDLHGSCIVAKPIKMKRPKSCTPAGAG